MHFCETLLYTHSLAYSLVTITVCIDTQTQYYTVPARLFILLDNSLSKALAHYKYFHNSSEKNLQCVWTITTFLQFQLQCARALMMNFIKHIGVHFSYDFLIHCSSTLTVGLILFCLSGQQQRLTELESSSGTFITPPLLVASLVVPVNNE